MSPCYPFYGVIHEAQKKVYGLNAASDIAAREFGYVDRIMRQIEPLAGVREHAESGFVRYAQDLQFYENLAKSLRPLIAEQVLLQPASLYNYTATLAQSQAILSQFTAQAVAQHYAMFDVSRIVTEINKQTAVAQAIGDFAERLIGDENLCEGLMSGLTSAFTVIPTNVAPPATFNYDALLRTIVERFDEVGMMRSESLYHVVLWRMHGWLESLPPNVRQLFIAIIAVLVGVIFQEAIEIGKDALKATPALQEKHVTPEDLDDVGGNMCR